MCAPMLLTALSMAVGAVQGIMQYSAQKQQYDAQVERNKENAANARTAAINKWESINTRAGQEGIAANQKKMAANKETAQAVATGQVAADEGGVSGISVNSLVRGLYGKGADHNNAVDANLAMNRSYLEGEGDVAQANAQNQINSMPIPEKPNFAAALVGIFGSGISAMQSYNQQVA